MKNMRQIAELNDSEYIGLVCAMTDDEEESREYCKENNIDFEDVKESDWGFDWQIGEIGVY